MIGARETPQIFFLNIGNSKEHIEKAVDELKIKDAIIFSSVQTRIETEFLKYLNDKGVNVLETHCVDPFTSDSLRNIISIMLSTIERYSKQGTEFIVGLTGGTNIMAVAFGVVAMIKGLRCNYILNQEEDFLLKIDTFKEIDVSVPLKEIGRSLREAKQ